MKTCAQRWHASKCGRVADLRDLLDAAQEGEDEPLSEYGLAFDYVPPGTYTDQREGYWRYQISYGGPSDEFRFYSSAPQYAPYRIEYWFLDWFDGHGEALTGQDEQILMDLWGWLEPSVQAVYDNALGHDSSGGR